MRPTKKNLELLTKDVFYDKGTVAPEFIDYYYESVREHGLAHPFIIMNRFAGIRRVRDEFNLIGVVDKIDRPVMVIAGENDPIVSWNEEHRHAFAKIPGAQIKNIQKSGHVPSTERADIFNEMVITFLTS